MSSKGLKRKLPRKQSRLLLIYLLTILLVIVVFWDSLVFSVQSGQQGVYWSRFFGGTSDRVLSEGAHFKLPWDEIYSYPTRIISLEQTNTLLSIDGLPLVVSWAVRYRAASDFIPSLHRFIGPGFVSSFIVPESIAALREVLGNSTAEQIYVLDRNSFVDRIGDLLQPRFNLYHIDLNRFIILSVKLPEDLQDAIIEKQITQQNLLAYKYKNEAAEREKEKKITEAEGISEFQKISGVSALKWKSVEAMESLAKSANAKVIIMGQGKTSFPFLLTDEKDKEKDTDK